MRLHADELDVDAGMVSALVADQFPEWRHLDVTPVAVRGTVHAVFRLGEEFAVRLPVRAEDPDVVQARMEREACAAAEFATVSPVPAPRAVALGRPGRGYPLTWAVQTWVPGHPSGTQEVATSPAFADDLAAVLTALRSAETRGRRFAGEGRGGLLIEHDPWVQECFARSEGLVDVPRLRRLWADLRDLPRPATDVMTHGDLVPGNVLVVGDRLAGVIDADGFGPADPALDLVGVWHLLEADGRHRVLDAVGCDEAERARGMAWALVQAIGLVWYYRDSHPGLSAVGATTLRRILSGPRSPRARA